MEASKTWSKEEEIWYDVSKLTMNCEEVEEESVKDRCLTSLVDKAGDRWPEGGSVEDKWSALRSALVESADDYCRGK